MDTMLKDYLQHNLPDVKPMEYEELLGEATCYPFGTIQQILTDLHSLSGTLDECKRLARDKLDKEWLEVKLLRQLQKILDEGEHLYFCGDDEVVRRVVKVGFRREAKYPDSQYEPAATFSDGTYAALSNCELSQFMKPIKEYTCSKF